MLGQVVEEALDGDGGSPVEGGERVDQMLADVALEAPEAFWLRHLRSGIALYSVGTVLAACYLAFTPDGPNRATEWVMVVVALVATMAVVAVPGRTIVRSRHRILFFVLWSSFSAVFVSAVAAVDGGLESPLAFLLLVPMTYASLAYPPRAVILIGIVAASSAVVVALISHDTLARTWMVVGTVGMVTFLAASVTQARTEHQVTRRRLTERLIQLATVDGLTGCLNHRTFYERLETELARSVRHGHRATLLVIDVDDFKSVNDRLGHLAGDEVLARIGSVLRSDGRASDIVGRIGGDEFAVVLVESDPAHAEAAARRFRARLAAEGDGLRASIGCAHFDGTAPSPPTARQLVAAADADLYAQKPGSLS
ncbi:MAG: GGDEF domain-containing protein [Acidimicrobiia bacterium]|jgi:diguanylate cyclase (GGDEF)-like protein